MMVHSLTVKNIIVLASGPVNVKTAILYFMIKVLHILGAPLGSGAGRAVQALHTELIRSGIDTRIIGRVEKHSPRDPRITPISLGQNFRSGVGNRLSQIWMRQMHGSRDPRFHPLSHGLSLHRLSQYHQPNLLHLQWVGAATLGHTLLRALATERRPIVWTLRDVWPFAGGCHFAVGTRTCAAIDPTTSSSCLTSFSLR